MTSAWCGNAATITGASSTGLDHLTIGKHGVLETLNGAGNGGRTIDDDLVLKKGAFDVNANTTFTAEKKGVSNKGKLVIAASITLTETGVTGSSFNDAKGSIKGSGELLVESPDTFKQGKAKIASTATVLVNGANLAYTGTGKGTIETEGVTTLTSGAPSSGQTLDVNGTCSLNANLTTTSSVTDERRHRAEQLGLRQQLDGHAPGRRHAHAREHRIAELALRRRRVPDDRRQRRRRRDHGKQRRL